MSKRTPEELSQANELTLREWVAMRILIVMLRVLAPTQWKHDIDEPLKDIEKKLGGK